MDDQAKVVSERSDEDMARPPGDTPRKAQRIQSLVKIYGKRYDCVSLHRLQRAAHGTTLPGWDGGLLFWKLLQKGNDK